jgi:hypothetical protein
MQRRLTTCAGCSEVFSKRRPAAQVCHFQLRGFPFSDAPNSLWAHPCGVRYHAGCIRVGDPFQTRLADQKGLICPTFSHSPHFICELCQVRAILRREAHGLSADIELLMLERMRIIDTYSWWQKSTMAKYGPYLNFISRFGTHYGVPLLVPSQLLRPPLAEAIPLMWSQLLYSLRETEGQRIKHGTVRALRSAASLFYTLDQQAAFAGRLRRTNKRHEICETVAPNEDVMATFATKGMARRMGTAPRASWALSHVHITYIDRRLRELYRRATTEPERHELACAGMANLSAYLGWLRGTELFSVHPEDLAVIDPVDGPTKGLPANIGAVTLTLLAETKSDPCQVADVVLAFTTLSDLSPGFWAGLLRRFRPTNPDCLFSTTETSAWTSRHFREAFAWPLLEEMRALGEPSLQTFTDQKPNRIQDKVYSIHSWRRAGRSRVSRPPRHNEPKPKGTRQATPTEVYEHGRWEMRRDRRGEDMPATYNQWELIDRLAITLLCM